MIDRICRVRDGVEITALHIGIWEWAYLKVTVVGGRIEESHSLCRRGIGDIGDRPANDVERRLPTANVDEWLPCRVHRMLWQRIYPRVEDVIVREKLIAA